MAWQGDAYNLYRLGETVHGFQDGDGVRKSPDKFAPSDDVAMMSIASKTYGTVSADRQNELTGLEFVQGLIDGTLPLNAIAQTLGYDVTEAAAGRVVVCAEPSAIHLNPAGTVHGGFAATLLAKLRSLPGIGEWTAQYIAMRELREPDAFPAADVGLLRAMTTADGRRPSPAELLSRAEPWRPWRAYAALHLWAADPDLAAVTGRRHEREAA